MAKQIARKELKEMKNLMEQGMSVKEISKSYKYPEILVRGSLVNFIGKNEFMKLSQGRQTPESNRSDDGVKTVKVSTPKEILTSMKVSTEEPISVENEIVEHTTYTEPEDNFSVEIGFRGKKILSDDLILAIGEDFESGLPIKGLSDKYNLSTHVIRANLIELFGKKKFNYLKDKNSNAAKKAAVMRRISSENQDVTNTTSKKSKKKVAKGISSSFKIIPVHRRVKAGLFKDRHDMPVKNFIFDQGIPSDKVLDYSYMGQIINKFIDENIPMVKGIPEVGLDIYVTGFQPALAELIKVCTSRKINLRLYHFDISSANYSAQVISENNKQVYPELPRYIQGISKTADEVYLVNMSIDDFMKMNEFYDVNTVKRPNGSPMVNRIYFTRNIEDSYKLFMEKSIECLESAQHKETGYNLYIHHNQVDSEAWLNRKNLQISSIDGVTETTEFHCYRKKDEKPAKTEPDSSK